MRPLFMLPLLALACVDDSHDPGPGSTATTADEAPGTTTLGTGNGDGAEICIDDYVGHNDLATALDLELDAEDDAAVALGNGVPESAAERGGDQLVVCGAAPADFFVFEARCPGWLSVELRAIDGTVPDLALHTDAGMLEEITGVWYEFFLKPVQRRIDAGTHVIEVRHAGGDPTRYSLAVMVLPARGCR